MPNKYDKVAIGQRIKQIRQAKGMTLEEFGKLFGTSKSIVYRWEKGTSKPNAERLASIAKVADTSVDYILFGTEEERLKNLSIEMRKHSRIAHGIDTNDAVADALDYYFPTKGYVDKATSDFMTFSVYYATTEDYLSLDSTLGRIQVDLETSFKYKDDKVDEDIARQVIDIISDAKHKIHQLSQKND